MSIPISTESAVGSALVSTIIPVYNRPALIREAVASVLAQDYRPIEIIIVDDGSTDNETHGVAQALAQAHPGMIRSVSQGNAGPGAAREHGRQLARGEFIQYLDSDDRLLPGKFSAQVRGLHTDAEAGISYGLTLEEDRLNGALKVAHATDKPRRTIFPHVLEGRLWPTLSPLYRRSVCDAIGAWSRQRIMEDLDYECRAGVLGTRLHYCPDAIAVVGDHGGEHAGLLWRKDPDAMKDRIEGYVNTLSYALRADVPRSSPQLQIFVRSLFWMSREVGALGWPEEACRLFDTARQHAANPGLDYILFGAAARMLGWRRAGKLARWLEGGT